jgi:hypothetical protein
LVPNKFRNGYIMIQKVCLRIPESTYVEFCMDLFWLMWIGVILGQPEFDLQDIPLFVVTSLSAGVLGACLNNIHDWLSQFRPSSRHKSLRFYWNSFSLLTSKSAHFFHKHFPSTNKLHALELQQFAEQHTVITNSNLTFFCLYGVCVCQGDRGMSGNTSFSSHHISAAPFLWAMSPNARRVSSFETLWSPCATENLVAGLPP